MVKLVETIAPIPSEDIRKQIEFFTDPEVKKTSVFVGRSILSQYDTPTTDSDIAALAATQERYDEGVTGLHIKHIIVDPDKRGQGLGSQLMAACIDYAKEQGHGYVQLDGSHDSPEAQRLVDGQGFKQFDDGPPILILK